MRFLVVVSKLLLVAVNAIIPCWELASHSSLTVPLPSDHMTGLDNKQETNWLWKLELLAVFKYVHDSRCLLK